MYVRDSLKHHRRRGVPKGVLETIGIEVEPTNAHPFIVAAWYRPTSDPIESFTKLEGNLQFFDRENKEIVFLGDTNCDIYLLENSPENTKNNVNAAAHMASIYDTFGLTQLSKDPTRETLDTATLFDHIASTHPENIPESRVLRVASSDQYAVYCIRKLETSAIKNKSSILMNSYKHVRNKVNNLGKKLKRDYFAKKIALYKGNLKETLKMINLLLNKRSKTTNVSCLHVEGCIVTDNNEIAHSMNDFFCSVGKKLSDDKPQQPNPLLSNEYNINEEGTSFRFKTTYFVSVEKALKKMKTLFGFGSDGITSHFIKIVIPVISHSLCRINNMSIES